MSIADALGEALDRLPVGVLLVDRQRRVLFSNQEARRIIQESDAICLTGGRLRARSAFQDKSLQRLIHGTAGSPAQPDVTAAGAVLMGSNGSRAHVLIAPLSGTASRDGESRPMALFITDPNRRARPSAEALRACFGFSPAEARVVRELLDGRRVKEIAAELLLTENTGRAYLKGMLAKTGCRSQAALVALVLRSVAAILPARS